MSANDAKENVLSLPVENIWPYTSEIASFAISVQNSVRYYDLWPFYAISKTCELVTHYKKLPQ